MNTQAPEKATAPFVDRLDVHSVWDTIQGEGPLAGRPAIFVRLAGCNLQCPFCDTDYTSQRETLSVEELITQIEVFTEGDCRRWIIVITGGEPFRQDLQRLCVELFKSGYTVQIETNGTMGSVDELSWLSLVRIQIVCCPKTPVISRGLRTHVTAWKYVLEEGFIDDVDGLPLSSLGMGHRVARPGVVSTLCPECVFVQPLDSGNAERNKINTEATLHSAMKHGYRLCLQIQKIIGVA